MLKKLGILATIMASSLVWSGQATAQSNADFEDFQTWGNITATGKFDSLGITNPKLEKFRWWMEGQGRFGDNSSHFSQALIRPGIGYQVHRTTTVWLGYAWAPTVQPFISPNIDEQRIWQQALWSDRFSFGTVALRSRIEERWVNSSVSPDVAYRYRQLIRILMPIPQAPKFGVVLADEMFVHLNNAHWGNNGPESGFDQNRGFAGIAYTINKNARTEIGYMNQYINRTHTLVNRQDHILSVNLFLNF